MEQFRGVKVRIEVDTNKDTYTLDEEYDSTAEACEAVAEFLDDERFTY